jgi:cell wall-associated NlpC family hydrolase
MAKKLKILTLVLLLFTGILQSQVTPWKLPPVEPEFATSLVNRNEVIEYAKSFIGKPYKYASADPAKGFDCSGFVHYVFKNYNINLPRGSKEYKALGVALKPEEFKVGDVLVFYGYRDNTHIGHVGIICEANGMNSRFIHSSSGKAYGVTISELNSEMYTRRFYKCVDVIK